MNVKHKVSLPHFGDYWVPIEYIVTHGVDAEYVVPPRMTKRTLDLGRKYSPDTACAPFKNT